MRTVLLGGRVIDPRTGLDDTADVVIEAGRVSRVGRGAADGIAPGERDTVVHDCAGQWLSLIHI